MAVQSPPTPPKTPTQAEPGIDAGVIEEARRRQRRHRVLGAALSVTVLIVGGLILGSSGAGGSGSGGGRHGVVQAPAPGSIPGHSASQSFPGAPASQPNPGGIAHDACFLAPPNRYLPPRSGCVTVRRADLTGNGQTYLVLLYSRLSHTHFSSPGAPASLSKEFMATRAELRVIAPNGVRTTTVLKGGPGAAALLGIANIGKGESEKIFIQVNEISSGSTANVYSLYHDRLTSAGISLGYGGDSGVQAGFSCLPRARVIQRVFIPLGNLLKAPWKETASTFTWHGPRLVKTAQHNYQGPPPPGDTRAGTGCFKHATTSISG